MLISFEGIDGAGKSSAITSITMLLQGERPDLTFVATREPGGTEVGNHIRAITREFKDVEALTRVMLFSADRHEHLQKVIKPALALGSVVLVDRYIDSTYAYGQAAGVTRLQIDPLVAMSDPVWPDLTFLLDLPIETAFKRRLARGTVHGIDGREYTYLQEVSSRYLSRAINEPRRFVIIDATVDSFRVAVACCDIAMRLIEERLD